MKKTDDLALYVNERKHAFVLLANEKYDDVLENPVLAYSTESSVQDEKNTSDADMIGYYTRVLRQLKADSVVYKRPANYVGQRHLPTVIFGQQKFDMLIIGERGMRVAGCVPTSATQMMYYHKWPEYAHGRYLFYRPNDGVLAINVEGMHLNWPADCSIYNNTNRRLIAPDRFLAINGMLFEANFGHERTSANMEFCKRSFVEHYGYSRKMVHSYDLEEDKMLNALRREIDAERPVMVGRWGHAFIIDGYDDDYLHFNLGWYGYRDGYYRIFPNFGRKAANDGWEMITGIMPEHKEKEAFTEKTVTLTQPGTLADHITEDDYDNLGKLKVIGAMNGKDIRLLRELSGGASIDVPVEKRGVLSSLDLSEATIMGAKEVYNEYWNFSDEHKSYMDCHEWNDCWQEEIIPHKAYITKLFTRKNEIGIRMFSGCDGLENIILPKNITHFGWSAFAGCTMLKSITIPSSVKYVKNNSFSQCKSLLEIHCDRKAQFIHCDTTATDTTVKHPFTGLYPYTDIIPE